VKSRNLVWLAGCYIHFVAGTSDINDLHSNSAQELLGHAIEMLESGGEASVRIHQILEKTGVTAPVLYRAFGSREGLIIAAQTERHRRAQVAAANLIVDTVERSHSVKELFENLRAALDIIFSLERRHLRLMRLQVLSSAVTRPALLEAIHEINDQCVQTMSKAFELPVAKQWIDAKAKIGHALLWGVALIDTRLVVELHESPDEEIIASWDVLSKHAILYSIFGENLSKFT